MDQVVLMFLIKLKLLLPFYLPTKRLHYTAVLQKLGRNYDYEELMAALHSAKNWRLDRKHLLRNRLILSIKCSTYWHRLRGINLPA